jgi:pilus assembly protein Flp/PilA
MEKILQDTPDLIWSFARAAATRASLAFFIRDESGATAIEYGLIAALIGVTVITTLKGAGSNLNAKFTAISNGLN